MIVCNVNMFNVTQKFYALNSNNQIIDTLSILTVDTEFQEKLGAFCDKHKDYTVEIHGATNYLTQGNFFMTDKLSQFTKSGKPIIFIIKD